MLEDDSTGLAMYRTGQIDCGPVALVERTPTGRRNDQENPSAAHYQDFLSNVTQAPSIMRTDMPPFSDVRVRRAISHAIDRQGAH